MTWPPNNRRALLWLAALAALIAIALIVILA